ncbi:MAG: hypothetical protein WA183_10375 [Chthoniobacterales bacterium]
MFQDGIARDGPLRIETRGLLFLLLREKEEVERPGSERNRDGDTDVRAEGRLFLAGDWAHVHQIAITLLKQRLAASVTSFSQQGDIYHGPPPSISPAELKTEMRKRLESEMVKHESTDPNIIAAEIEGSCPNSESIREHGV